MRKNLKRLLKKCSQRRILGILSMFSLVSVPISLPLIPGSLDHEKIENQENLAYLVLENYTGDAYLRNEEESRTPFVTVQGASLLAYSGVNQEQDSEPVEPKTSFTSLTGIVEVTAYSSTVDQTDSSPFITANGSWVHDGTLACNFLPFGTKVKFPSYFGDKIFIVEDRMSQRFSHRMDIWFPTRAQALQFGRQYLEYQVVEEA